MVQVLHVSEKIVDLQYSSKETHRLHGEGKDSAKIKDTNSEKANKDIETYLTVHVFHIL